MMLRETLLSIGPDIKKRITDYLGPEDAISFSRTCKIVHDDLDLKILTDVYSYSKHLDAVEQNFRPLDYHEGDKERIWFRFFPIVLKNPIHTIKFTCYAKDQGWGNRKGRIYVRQDKNENNYQGDIVAESPLLDHEEMYVSLQFRPEYEKKYTLCYVIGGGGGHELYVKYPKVYTLFYHNNGIVDTANIFRAKDVVPLRNSNFGVKMLIGVVDRLIQDCKHQEATMDIDADAHSPGAGVVLEEDTGTMVLEEKHHQQQKQQQQHDANEEEDTLASSLASIGINPHKIESLSAAKQFLQMWLAFKDPRSRRRQRIMSKRRK